MKLGPSFPDRIQNIIFDIGNVLIDLDIPATLEAFESLHIGGLHSDDIHPHQTGFFLDYELGNIDDQGFITAIRQKYDCSGVSDQAIFDAWNAMLKDPEMERFGMIRTLGHHYRLFVLSNTNNQHIAHLQRRFQTISGGLEFESFFAHCFYSHELHLRKPDPEIYRRVMAETGVISSETLFIDDNRCNILAAGALLLETHHLTGEEKVTDLFR